ncbi:unnamed protein product [Lampetra planeri]
MIAVYDEQEPHHGGDGTSASSTGTQSPDLFTADLSTGSAASAFQPYQAANMPLHVRRSSDPRLNEHQRPVQRRRVTGPNRRATLEEEPNALVYYRWLPESSPLHRHQQPGEKGTWANQREFQRETARSSLSANHPMVDRWLERQEQVGRRTGVTGDVENCS